jgi:hypothetical protein
MQQHLDVYNYDFSDMAYEAVLCSPPIKETFRFPQNTSLYYITELL